MATFRNPFFATKTDARTSRNARNPRFAPEFLDRRLSPSSFGFSPVFAEVSYIEPMTEIVEGQEPLPTDADGDPIPMPTTDDGTGLAGPI